MGGTTKAPEAIRAASPERDVLGELAEGLRPEVNRARGLARLDELFRTGSVPDPWPDGFLEGRLLTMSVWGPFDGSVRRIADLWMPWQGKSLDAGSAIGVNWFVPRAKVPLRVVFPRYSPELVTEHRIEAFPFRNRIAPGAIDPEVHVLKIDYDFEANPGLIRRILDEVVQVAPGVYVGKILFGFRGVFHPIGFFSLREERR